MIIKQSLKAIFVNKGRSFLTILGIVIGIGSVIALISLGAGVRNSIAERLSSLGTTNLTIMPGAGFGPGAAGAGGGNRRDFQSGSAGFAQAASTLTEEDLLALADPAKHPGIKHVSGQISGSAIFETAGGERRYTVLGTSASYLEMQRLKLQQGVFYDRDDVAQTALVAVLGSQLARDLYGTADPIGAVLNIEGTDYTVIGILQQADESALGNPNSQAYVPYTAAAETFKSPNFSWITVQVADEGEIEKVKEEITATLLANHQINDAKLADFSVSSAADLLSAVSTITNMLTALLASIAAISLVVGGIGIMNIMLVSVTERTREIGLRKAVGAKTADILGQFITEAVLLTLTGGIFGIGLGFLIGRVAALVIGFTPLVTGGAVALAVGVSSAVGLLFGIYPAAKAANLNPIDALRYE
jgi:putative ABC transport system permease protein